MPTEFQQSREFDPGFVAPRADYGAANAFEQAFKMGFNENFTGMGYRATKYWLLKRNDEIENRVAWPMAPDRWVDKEEFEREFSMEGKIKFDPHYEGKMSRAYAKALLDDHIDDELNRRRSGQSYAPLTGLAGTLLGGIASPIDLAIGIATPEIAAAKWGLGATVASRSGTGAARFASRTVNGAVNGAVQGAAQQPFVMALAASNQQQYTVQDALAAVGLAPIIGAGAGAIHAGIRHTRGEWDRSFANAATHAALGDKDPALLKKILESDPAAKEAYEFNQKIKEALKKPVEERTAAEGEIIAMADDTPDDILAARRTQSRAHTRKIIDDVLNDPNDRRIGGAVTDDEKFLAEAWKNLFGVELRYVDSTFASSMGFRGFTRPSDPTRAYIARNALNDGSIDSMMFVAGHELGHSVRLRSPKVWSDMVEAMMKTSNMENGALASAWTTVVRHNKGNGVWTGLDLNGRMDETFATVLGRAVMHNSFWQALHQQSPESASVLGRLIYGIRTRLNGMLETKITKQTKSLYEGLSQSLMVAGLDSKIVTVEEGLKYAGMYDKHRPEFKKLMGRMSPYLNKIGLEKENELAMFETWHQEMFPQVGSLDDASATPSKPGRFATIIKNRRIDSDNPGLFLLTQLFAKAKPGTPEHALAKKFAERRVRWDRTSRTASGGKDYVASAMKEYPALAAFKKNPDGTWDIGIYRNDDFPRWYELFLDEPSDVDLVTRTFVQEQIDSVREAYLKFTGSEASLVPGRDDMLSRYMNSLDWDEFIEGPKSDPSAFWAGYIEFLEARMAEHIGSSGSQEYRFLDDLRRKVDPLARPQKEGKSDTAPSTAELDAAWAAFVKDYAEIKNKLTERNLAMAQDPSVYGPVSWGFVPEPPKQFFEEMFKETRSILVQELSEVRHMMDRLRGAKDGDFGLMDKKGRSFFARDSAKLDARMEKAIDEMTHDRIRNTGLWPQYDRVMQIGKAVEDFADAETISISTAAPDKLPNGYKDASDFFDTGNDNLSLSDEYTFMAADPEDVTRATAVRRLSAADAAAAAYSALERAHAELAAFANTPEAATAARLEEVLARNGAAGWSLEPKPASSSATATPPPTGPLVDQLDQLRKRLEAQLATVGTLLQGKAPRNPEFQSTIQAVDRYKYHTNQGHGPSDAARRAAEDLTRAAQARALQIARGFESKKRLTELGHSLDVLYSHLDGSPRKGVTASGASVAEAIVSRVQSDVAPFVNALIDSGLDELWREGNPTVVRDLIAHMKGIVSEDPRIRRLADTLKKIQEVQVGRMNAEGADIRLLDGFVFSQIHNPHAIRNNKEAFVADLIEWLDWPAVERAYGKIPNRGDYLRGVWEELASGDQTSLDFDPRTMGGNIANRVSHRRTLYFRGTSAYDYDMKYGSGNTSGLITEQIVKRAELGTVMQHFGPDYKDTWNSVLAELRRPGDWRAGKLARIDTTFRYLVGDLNHPEDVRLSEIGQAVRNAMNSVSLWLSGVSSLTDIGNATSTMRWMGVSPSDLTTRLTKAMADNYSKGPKERQFLIAQGAGLQALLTGFTRTVNMSGPLYQLAQKASDFTFKYNGQEIWTKTLQSAFHDLTTQHLGQMAGLRDLPTEFANWLKHYGITTEEWQTMARDVAEIEGLEGVRLAPDLVQSPALAQKLRVAMNDSMHQAILEPSASDKALLTLGTKAGTVYGEAVRLVTQYKSYPLAMIRRTQRRFQNAYGNESLTAFGTSVNNAQLEWLVWAGTMLSLATTVLSIKDMLRGREPMNPFDTDQWTIGNASRIVAQAGVGPLAVAEQFLSPQQALGPAFGTAYNIGSAVAAGSGYRTTNAVMGTVPVLSAGPIKEASKAILGTIFADSYGQHYQTFLRHLERETGQSSIYLDN